MRLEDPAIGLPFACLLAELPVSMRARLGVIHYEVFRELSSQDQAEVAAFGSSA